MSISINIDDNGVMRFSENKTEFFTVSETPNEESGWIELSFCGEFRHGIATHVYDEINALASLDKNVRIDAKNLNYISNASIHCLLQAQQRMDAINRGQLVIADLPKEIYNQFDELFLTQLLMIE